MTTLPLWMFFPNCLGTCSTFTMLMKPLYACCIPFRQPAVAVCLHSLDAPWTFCTVFCCRERLSKSILKASSDGFSSGRCWQDLLQKRGWWQRLDCKATVFSNELHVDQTSLYTRSNDAPLCFRVATTCAVLLFVVITGTNCPSCSLPSYNQWWICRLSDIFLHVSLAPVLWLFRLAQEVFTVQGTL